MTMPGMAFIAKSVLFLSVLLLLAQSRHDSILKSCCGAGNIHLLEDCIHRNSLSSQTDAALKVGVVSLGYAGSGDFAIPDIKAFSVYQEAVMAAYCQLRGYTHTFFNTTAGLDFQNTTDSRWYKIKILLDAINANGWAENFDFVVWIDADAVVLDFSFAIEKLAEDYPGAHVMASSDIRMGLINTGVLVIRNSPWARRFLEQWWYGPANGDVGWRDSQCDQDAFDRLYAQYAAQQHSGYGERDGTRTVKEILVLPMDALNSRPPATLHQKSHNAILHLMGEATDMRRKAFQHAWEKGLCGAGETPLPQLGLQRSVLQDMAREVYGDGVQELLTKASAEITPQVLSALVARDADGSTIDWSAVDGRLNAEILKPMEGLSTAAHHYCDLLRHLALQQSQGSQKAAALHAEELRLRQRILGLVTERIVQFRAAAAQHVAVMTAKQQSNSRHDDVSQVQRLLMGTLAQLLKRAAEAGNDVFGVVPTAAEKRETAQLVFGFLEEILEIVDASSRHIPLHMQALMHQNLGALEHSLAGTARGQAVSVHLDSAVRHLRASVAAFAARKESLGGWAEQDSSTLMEESYSQQLLAGSLCELGKYDEALKLWERTITHARQALLGIEVGVRYSNLGVVLYNAALCHTAASRTAESRALAMEARGVAERSAAQGAEGSQINALLAAIDALLMQVSSAGVVAGVVEPVQTSDGGGAGAQSYRMTGGQGGDQRENEEWVECELHENCDLFEVVDPAQQETRLRTSKLAQGGAEDVLAGVDVEGMSPEEVEELREVRERYFRQARRSVAPSSAPGVDSRVESSGHDTAQHSSNSPAASEGSSQASAIEGGGHSLAAVAALLAASQRTLANINVAAFVHSKDGTVKLLELLQNVAIDQNEALTTIARELQQCSQKG